VFEQVEGRLVARRDDEGVSIALQRFGFLTGDGVRWPQGDLALSWRQREGQPVSAGQFSAQRLDLDVMAQVATRVPLGEALRQLLAELNPQGVVTGLDASWTGPLDAPVRYQAKALFNGLSLAAKPAPEPNAVGRPGLRNASLQVTATETGGQAQLNLTSGALEFPGVFDEPLVPFDTLAAQLGWKIEPGAAGAPPRVSVQVKDGRFANPDAQGELSGSWSTGPGQGLAKGGRLPGQIELNGRIVRGDAAKIARYLPLHMAQTRQYLGRALRGGAVQEASFRVKGDLWDFPFFAAKSPKDGEFRIAGRVKDATFDYVPSEPAVNEKPAWVSPWPALTRVAAEVIIDRASLEIRDGSAQLGSVVLGGVQGGVRNLADRSVLALDGTVRGPLTEMLRFVNVTPVGQWTGQALARATATGAAELKLGLSLPLYDLSASTVKGGLALAGNDVRITPDTPLLGGARARIDFTHKSLSVSGASADCSVARPASRAACSPTAACASAARARPAPRACAARRTRPVSRLASSASAARRPTGWPGLRAGAAPRSASPATSSGWPPNCPRRCASPPRRPGRCATRARWCPSRCAGQSARDTVRLELGSVFQAQYVRDLTRRRAARAARSHRRQRAAARCRPGRARQRHARRAERRCLAGAWPAACNGGRRAGRHRRGGRRPVSGYLPAQIALRAQSLQTGARRLNRVVVGASQGDRRLARQRRRRPARRLRRVPPARPRRRQAAGRVYARLARLSLPKSRCRSGRAPAGPAAAHRVPALDIVIDDFELRGKKLGRSRSMR
jgi:uncharacterized protein YhdP